MAGVIRLVLAAVIAASLHGATPGNRPAHPSFVPIQDQPGLPRVLLIGDSISMGYTLEVRSQLAGIANVHRPPANGNSSGYGLAQLAKWLGDGKWDVIHFNFGIHDAKLPPEGKYHSPPEAYEENLREIVRRLQGTGARLIWATSTPIPLGGMLAPDRRFGDITVYNEVARRVMIEAAVAINDLHAAIAPHVSRVQVPGDLHYTPQGYSILAGQTAAAIREQLRRVPAAGRSVDLIVYGGTAGGIFSAIAASRRGSSVLVLEPGTHLGGMVTSGLGDTDTGQRETIGGMAADFYRRVFDYYEEPSVWRFERRDDYISRLGANRIMSDGKWWKVEPSAAASVLGGLMAEGRVEVLTRHRLSGVTKNGSRITSLKCENGAVFSARVFIDATYEGDLMARAGVTYRVGRESAAEYGEPYAGVVPREFCTRNQVDVDISAFDAHGQLVHGVYGGDRGEDGAGDRKVQAYNYRLCLTNVPGNRVPTTRPEHYDPSWYELYARYLAAKPELRLAEIIGGGPLPNGKTDNNGRGPFGIDIIGFNWEYPDGDQQTRDKILRYHEDFTKGLLYFLGHDERVPKRMREEMREWEYPADEFRDNDHFPPQIYVREARRMVGAYVMTSHDITRTPAKEDAVGLASYKPDSHIVQRIVEGGFVRHEGNPNDFTGSARPYEVPYRALTPRKSECDNLLVTFCLSATHMAFASLRMEPVFMILSESAGAAAVQAVQRGAAVQDIDILELQRTLRQDGQILKLTELPGTPRRSAR